MCGGGGEGTDGAKLPLPGAAGALSFILLKGKLKGLRESRQEGASARPAPQLLGRGREYFWQRGVWNLCRRWGTDSPHGAGGAGNPRLVSVNGSSARGTGPGCCLLQPALCTTHFGEGPVWVGDKPPAWMPGLASLPPAAALLWGAATLQVSHPARTLSPSPLLPGISGSRVSSDIFSLLLRSSKALNCLPLPAPSGSPVQREPAGPEVRRPRDSHSICNNRKGRS